MDGLSADKLRIFLHPVESESRPRLKLNENESAGPEEGAATTLPSVVKQDQVIFRLSSDRYLRNICLGKVSVKLLFQKDDYGASVKYRYLSSNGLR
jgi:hypothetical protein